ncbi:signal-regulatory protein beta-2-like [Chelmon rostratus]|uniref:signal-regulatory protein beta-2-like n=1 Tax=Chelmon rostratus TaxID=109905 RepID=UPI001BEC4EF5|nr:signal-regulatory protein beta-2-like [Chelmon rostratus]
MAIIFYLLLMLRVGRCSDDQNFVTKTIGQSATLTCTHQRSQDVETLFWIKLVAGNLPDILGKASSFDEKNVKEISHMILKQEPGRFVLNITETRLTDTAFYYCLKSRRFSITFLKGVFLRVEGPEPDITAVVQVPPSDPVHPGDPVTLQCSVLSDSERKTCPGGLGVYWFRAGSHESHPSVIYAPGNSGDECEKSPEARSPHKCVYNFFKDDISSSDAGTYYCAVATCGQMLFGNGTKLDVEVGSTCDSQKADTVLYLVCAALALSLVLVAFLLYAIRKKSCDCCDAVVTLQANAASASGDQQSQQRNEDSLVYSAPDFTRRKAVKSGRRSARKEETIYAEVRAFVMDP